MADRVFVFNEVHRYVYKRASKKVEPGPEGQRTLVGVLMGRTFKSVRMESQEVAQRWLKASRSLSKDDQVYGQRLAEMVKMHSSEALYALDDPLEAAIFSVLIELVTETDREEVEKRDDVDL